MWAWLVYSALLLKGLHLVYFCGKCILDKISFDLIWYFSIYGFIHCLMQGYCLMLVCRKIMECILEVLSLLGSLNLNLNKYKSFWFILTTLKQFNKSISCLSRRCHINSVNYKKSFQLFLNLAQTGLALIGSKFLKSPTAITFMTAKETLFVQNWDKHAKVVD